MKNKYKPIDEHFREVLSHHSVTPTEEARKAFLKECATMAPSRSKYRRWLWWMSLILIPAGASMLTWMVLPSVDEAEFAVPSSHVTTPSAENASHHKSTGQTTDPSSEKKHTILARVAQEEIQKLSDLKKPASMTAEPLVIDHQTVEPQVLPVESTLTAESVPEFISVQSGPDITPSVQSFDTARSNPIIEIPADIPVINNAASDTSVIKREKNPPVTRTESSRSAKLALQLGAGISWSPEWMFNTLEGTKNIHTFALEGIFSIGPYSIRTGAGLHIGKGTNEVLIDYHDYLGAYNKLDSMDFNYNTSLQKYVPVYYLSRREVWDSLMKTDQARIVKRYTYLQIPMILGYDFLRNERFSLGLRMGPQLSVLLSTKQLSAPYDPGKNMVVRVNDISPGQIELNWQLLAGLNVSVSLSEQLRLEVEPFAKYYFNSVYEKPANQQKPWSAGIRTALVIDL